MPAANYPGAISNTADPLRIGLPVGHTGFICSGEFSPDGKLVVTAGLDNTAKVWDCGSGKMIYDLLGSTQGINSASFSPDGKKIVTASIDGKAKLWDVNTGLLLIDFSKHTDAVRTARFSYDGKKVITASNDNSAKIWDTETGKLLIDLRGHHGTVQTASFSPDGQKVVTASDDSLCIIWDANTGRLLYTLKGHTEGVESAEFSPDGKTLVTASNDRTAIIWDVAKGKLRYILQGHTRYVNSAVFSPDGKKVITASDDETAKIWEVASGKLLLTLTGHEGMVYSAEFSADGKKIVTASIDGLAKIWDASSGRLLVDLKGHKGWVNQARFSADGSKVITVSDDRSAIIWDTQTGNLLSDLCSKAVRAFTVQYSSDGQRFITNSEFRVPKMWDAHSGRLLYNLVGHTQGIGTIEFSPDNQKVLTASFDNTAKLWDVSNGKLLLTLAGHEKWITTASFSPDGKKIATASADNTIKLWDAATGTLLFDLIGHEVYVEGAKFSPDGKQLATYSNDGVVKVWEVETGKLKYSIPAHDKWITTIQYSPDGKNFATSSADQTAKIWNASNGQLLFDLIGHFGYINSLQYSPDGKKLATAGDDQTVKIWDTQTGTLLYSLAGHTSYVKSARFSPDGKTLLTASYSDNIPRVWDLETGKLLFELIGHTRDAYSAEYSPDGKKIITASNDSKCMLWDASTGQRLLTLIALDSSDFVVLHASGLFDASPGAMQYMYWLKGMDVIEFGQLKDRYWEPGLWEKVMQGEQLRDVRGMNELKLQPDIELTDVKDGKLAINVTKREGGYGRIVVMINGKEVEADARGNGFDTTKLKQTVYFNLKDNPLLKSGEENSIVVKAWSADGFVEGRGIQITYMPAGDTISEPPSLFAVVLGISEYSSSAIHLNYAKPDAMAIATAIRLGGENLFGADRTFVYCMTSPGDITPSKANIHQLFTDIKSKAKPGDVLVVYLSGHGISWGGEGGDFYYLTADAYSSSAESYNDPAIRAANCISTNEFTEWINDIPALKQLMIIDACGSGKAVDNLLAQRSVDPSQMKSIDRMKDRTGMYIISGCAADRVSYEASKYGQGLLTFTVLQAMKGAALREEKFIDVSMLLNYAREEVPKLAVGLGGLQQPQLLIPKGGSFDIGMLNDNDKSKIPLASPKPVFVRTTFIDAEQLEDILNIAKAVDEALIDLSTRNGVGPVIFVDSREYPDGCKISGTYTQSNGKITLRYKIKCGTTVQDFSDEATSVSEIVKLVIAKVAAM